MADNATIDRCPIVSILITNYHANLKTWVVPLHSSNGSLICVSSCQSDVRQTLRYLSSDCEAMYFPIGSHVTPFTIPECCFSTDVISKRIWLWCKVKTLAQKGLHSEWFNPFLKTTAAYCGILPTVQYTIPHIWDMKCSIYLPNILGYDHMVSLRVPKN